MNRRALDDLLSQIRTRRTQVLDELADLTETEFAYPTAHQRWSDVRRVLLRFGDHMREHANQVEGARQLNGHAPTMPQRMLAEAEVAWGKLLAATVGLSDAEMDAPPPDGGWTIRQVLEHILASEENYLRAIRESRDAHGQQR